MFTVVVSYFNNVLFAGLHKLASEDLIIKHRYTIVKQTLLQYTK